MAWEHLSINKPHLVYIILGGFTSLFMLCSSVIKEKLYIGEATVATLCGIIFGPHAANLIDPLTWGNTDLITLEFSRIVLVVQCFAVGVELPKSYMERHWKSVSLLLIPVMTFGWLITSLFVWWMFGERLNWLDSLCIAACVTATDPVLASSVVGKGKFAKRVPKHLRDLLSAESGCNDGMAFPFIYLAIYLIRYRPDAEKVSLHWFCYTILYECVFGAVYGVVIGYIARRLIRYSHEKDLIDRESFLVFYFVLALFCAGSGSILGMDDLLIGFACGVGFSNDGWFLEKTEESHVSNVIDLLINLAFFVYFGTIIPWAQFNSPILGITPWRLVVLSLLVLFFRRIPIMLMLKPIIPDIKTWREALFAGHFGPIGVGAIFVAILARAELEHEESTPLADLPEPGFEHMNIIEMIWPITTFLVITSIIVHGSSVAVFTLGKHINTLTLTLSYTQANEDGPSWMDRLPRIQSRSRSSMSMRRPGESDSDMDEKSEGLLPIGLPGQFLRRQRHEASSRSSSLAPRSRRRKRESGLGPGGPVSQSAIVPQSNRDYLDVPSLHRDSDTIAVQSDDSPDNGSPKDKSSPSIPQEEIYQEGNTTVIEDEEGNVLEVRENTGKSEREQALKAKEEGKKVMKEKDVEGGVAQTEHMHHASPAAAAAAAAANAADKNLSLEHASLSWNQMRKRMESISGLKRHEEDGVAKPKPVKKRGPALAYQFGNTIIVEDEDGEVIKKYDIPGPARPQVERKMSILDPVKTKQHLHRMGEYFGMAHHEAGPSDTQDDRRRKKKQVEEDEDDEHIRFTVTAGGRRMSKMEFIQQMKNMDPKARAQLVEDSDAPERVKEKVRQEAKEHTELERARQASAEPLQKQQEQAIADTNSADEPENVAPVPFHSIRDDLARFSLDPQGGGETAAERRRRRVSTSEGHDDDEGGPTTPRTTTSKPVSPQQNRSKMDEGETAAERKRREGALGITNDDDDSDSDEEEDAAAAAAAAADLDRLHNPPTDAGQSRARGIRFAEPPMKR